MQDLTIATDEIKMVAGLKTQLDTMERWGRRREGGREGGRERERERGREGGREGGDSDNTLIFNLFVLSSSLLPPSLPPLPPSLFLSPLSESERVF